ncbi:MAG TPA: PilZ domain-containing protein [Candidatus Hodarchaeales archaeon]|nr:PilZ domain-containing protein [Candidatus Hodarchaeales archaeon]
MSKGLARNQHYYSKFGKKAAILSLLFPGLGQLQNKSYLKGTLVVSLFSFVVALRLMIGANPNLDSSGFIDVILNFFPLAVWGISIYDAYYSAIETRRLEAMRHNVQIITAVRGYDADNLCFEEITMTKNVSRRGACLIMSRLLKLGSVLSLEFEGKSKSAGRVVWSRETGNYNELLVGMELLAPLKKFNS